MCFIELVDYDENMAKETVKKSTRTRRRTKKAATDAVEVVEEAPKTEETPAVEESKAE
jgi:large subunit ribosomal protein L17